MPIKVKDNGADALMDRINKMPPTMTIRVGVLGNTAFQKKLSREENAEDLTVVQVAEKNEFGIGVPRRSFIRDYHDQNLEHIKKRMKHYAGKVWDAKNASQVRRQIDRLGLELVDGIVTRIEEGIPPANSQMTIDRKGSETPLIDTGQLKSSIIYEVEDGGS